MTRLSICVVLVAVVLSGCAPQFVLGPEVAPPQGCVEARGRGHDC
jgi:hypothetical protein